MYLGMSILVVASGTVVAQDKDGIDLIVTDDNAVTNGKTIWVTQHKYELLKAASKSNAA